MRNERFEIEVEIERPLNSARLRTPDDRILLTPVVEASCDMRELCEVVEVSYKNCLPDDFIQPAP